MNSEPNSPQQSAGEPPSHYGQAQQSPNTSPPPSDVAPQVGPQGHKPPRRLPATIVVLLIVLAVVLIAGGGGLIYYTTVYQPNLKHAQATATAEAQLMATAQANATSTAQANATATSIAQENATATAVAAIAQANATATAVVLSRDPYLPNKGTWVGNPLGSPSPLTPSANGISLTQNSLTPYTNLVYQIQVTMVSGNTTFGGLLFRYQANGRGLYLFQVDIHGDYQFGTYSINTRNLNLLQTGTSPAIKTGLNQVNTLAVVAQGSNFDFYVNLQHIASASNSTFSQGGIGVFSYNPSDAQAEVDIGYISLWTL